MHLWKSKFMNFCKMVWRKKNRRDRFLYYFSDFSTLCVLNKLISRILFHKSFDNKFHNFLLMILSQYFPWNQLFTRKTSVDELFCLCIAYSVSSLVVQIYVKQCYFTIPKFLNRLALNWLNQNFKQKLFNTQHSM